jgi:hypothetical protein
MAAIMTSVSNDVWTAVANAVKDNPTLAILSLVVASFAAGFAARKYFQDRELSRLKALGEETARLLAGAEGRVQELEAPAKDAEALLTRISECLLPDALKNELAPLLRLWAPEKHDLLIVAIIRQLLTTPGAAWVCTPAGTALVKIEWDEQRRSCKVSTRVDSQDDPIRQLREFPVDPTRLSAALLEVALFGITIIAVPTGPTQVQRMVVRQGPGLGWHVEKQTLERARH